LQGAPAGERRALARYFLRLKMDYGTEEFNWMICRPVSTVHLPSAARGGAPAIKTLHTPPSVDFPQAN